jgi:hypothetical protein
MFDSIIVSIAYIAICASIITLIAAYRKIVAYKSAFKHMSNALSISGDMMQNYYSMHTSTLNCLQLGMNFAKDCRKSTLTLKETRLLREFVDSVEIIGDVHVSSAEHFDASAALVKECLANAKRDLNIRG